MFAAINPSKAGGGVSKAIIASLDGSPQGAIYEQYTASCSLTTAVRRLTARHRRTMSSSSRHYIASGRPPTTRKGSERFP